MRRGILAVVGLTLLLAGYTLGRAAERDELTLTVQLTAADHEIAEGYFSLGESASVMVKPGSALHRFLSRQRGRTVTLTLAEGATRELSRLDR